MKEKVKEIQNKKDVIVLGIESSCDETSIAVVKNGREVLSNVISSQIDIHTRFGGVVPEVASRNHIEAIDNVLNEALTKTKITKVSNFSYLLSQEIYNSMFKTSYTYNLYKLQNENFLKLKNNSHYKWF